MVSQYSARFRKTAEKVGLKALLPSHMVIMDYIARLDARWSPMVNAVRPQTLEEAEDIARNIESATTINRTNQTNETAILMARINQLEERLEKPEDRRPQGSAAQKKWTNSWSESQHQNWRKEQTCYNCGKKGHIRPDCRVKPQQPRNDPRRYNSNNNQRKPFNGTYHNCGKKGHKQVECRARINNLEYYSQTDSESEDSEFERDYETNRNIQINRRQVSFNKPSYSEYNTGVDFYYQMANVTFGDLAGIPKYNRQIREVAKAAAKAARQKEDTDGETSESEDDGAEVT